MPYLPTAQSWLQNSAHLLSARPTTTRITTKYTILHPPSSDSAKVSRPQSQSKSKSAPPAPAPTPGSTPMSQHQRSKAILVLKTYDPVSGTCLKYRTDKAADVGRLIAALGTCGRAMAALPEKEKETEKEEEGGEEVGAAEAKGKMDGSEVLGKGGDKERDGKAKVGAGGGGGGGKKKKGKR
ncbi:hypothetical protein MMC07_001288 [Pseudocyphellaria aurata]|nr:hypothetical protein [Pseudocyphellaria aurata]